MKNKPLILIANDDGITAPGIKALINIAKDFGEVVVVAPDSPQSAKGHALTITAPLRLKETDIFGDIKAFECSGTPVDCVKLAKNFVLENRKIDLCLSGINHGSNVSSNILYSGTMSAAMEASMEGVDSIGFSLLDFSMKADFSQGTPYIKQIIAHELEHGPKTGRLLNVNIPKIATSDIKGIKVCRQANARWKENYTEGTDPYGGKYYWLSGEFVNHDTGEDTDVWALENNFVSVVPSMHDLTDYKMLEKMKSDHYQS